MLDANTGRKKLYLVSVSHWYDLYVFGMTLLRYGYEFGIQFFRQHAASIYGFFRQSVSLVCREKKFRPLLSKVGG